MTVFTYLRPGDEVAVWVAQIGKGLYCHIRARRPEATVIKGTGPQLRSIAVQMLRELDRAAGQAA